MEFKKREVKAFKPTKDEMLRAMNEVSQYFSDDKVLGSKDHPELKVRGKQPSKPDIMKYEIVESHQIFKDNKIIELAVLWVANEDGSVRATYCDNKPKAGYEYLLPNDELTPELLQKVAGYGMDLPDNKKHFYFPAVTNWER